MKEYSVGARAINTYTYTVNGEEKSVMVYIKGVFRTKDATGTCPEGLSRQFCSMTAIKGWGSEVKKDKVANLPKLAEEKITLSGDGEIFLLQVVSDRPQGIGSGDYKDLQEGARQFVRAAAERYKPAPSQSGSARKKPDTQQKPSGGQAAGKADAGKGVYDRKPPKPMEKESAGAYYERICAQWSELALTCRKLEAENKELSQKGTADESMADLQKQCEAQKQELKSLRAKVSSVELREQYFNTGLDVMSQGNAGEDLKGKILEIVNRVINSGREISKMEGGE